VEPFKEGLQPNRGMIEPFNISIVVSAKDSKKSFSKIFFCKNEKGAKGGTLLKGGGKFQLGKTA